MAVACASAALNGGRIDLEQLIARLDVLAFGKADADDLPVNAARDGDRVVRLDRADGALEGGNVLGRRDADRHGDGGEGASALVRWVFLCVGGCTRRPRWREWQGSRRMARGGASCGRVARRLVERALFRAQRHLAANRRSRGSGSRRGPSRHWCVPCRTRPCRLTHSRRAAVRWRRRTSFRGQFIREWTVGALM